LPAKARIIDIGFFIPVVPITLAKPGFHVSSIENLAFYDNALNDIISLVSQSYGIEVFDFNILHDDIGTTKQYDAVILSAILEHLNGTPKYLLNRTRVLGKDNAYHKIAVPNVAAIRKRISLLLKGSPPFPSISAYFHSAYPFTGHNREYTVRDLMYVLKQSGFDIIHLETYNRSATLKRSFTDCLLSIVALIGPISLCEKMLAVARKSL